VGLVTSFARPNLIRMGKNMFLLTLVLAGTVAASQAQGNSNHLSGQTSLYLKRAVSQPVDWYPWGAGAFHLRGHPKAANEGHLKTGQRK
jgi:Protein of unknown function, DUF255